MGVGYAIVLHAEVVKKDIPALDTRLRNIVKKAIETKLVSNPVLYGVPLRQNLAGYRKLRVQDYRVIFRINTAEQQVEIIAIQHRSVVYGEKLDRRR